MTAAAAVALAAWWAFVVWRVRVEDGFVGLNAFARLRLHVAALAIILADRLIPTILRTTERMREWADELERQGYRLEYDLEPIIPER